MPKGNDRDPRQTGKLQSTASKVGRSRTLRHLTVAGTVCAVVGGVYFGIYRVADSSYAHDQAIGSYITTKGALQVGEKGVLKVTIREDNSAVNHVLITIDDTAENDATVNGSPSTNDNFLTLNTVVGGDCQVSNDSLSCPGLGANQVRTYTIDFVPSTNMSVLWGTEQDGSPSAFLEVVN